MDLTPSELKLVLLSVKQYRASLYNLVKDMDSSLDQLSKANLAQNLATLTEVQEKILQISTSSDSTYNEEVSPPVRVSKSSASVLIAEDDELTAELIKSTLEDLGFTDITWVDNGQAAIESIESNSYSLIICDWKMPNNSGLEVHKHVKEQLDNTVFILLTATSDEVLQSRAKKQGISEYMLKPIDIDQFDNMLLKYFE